MSENESKMVSISIDDFQYYVRRDERMSVIEKFVKEAIKRKTFINTDVLREFFDLEVIK